MFKHILMVCQGNICRSPMAEGYFRHKLDECQSSIQVSSAGLGAMVGYPADPRAQTVMRGHGIDISQHRGRQLTMDIVQEADLILVMTKPQRVILLNQYPTARGKTFLLGKWENIEIADPLKKPEEAFHQVYNQVEQAWNEWGKKLGMKNTVTN